MIVPSNGRSGVGLIIFAETWAKTLREHEVNNMYSIEELTHLVLPKAHSTHPSSGPKVKVGLRDWSSARPSSLRDCSRALKRNSRSGIDGEGGRMIR
jgi:hypothetical protein